MDKEVRFRTRVFKNNGGSKDYIGISINRSPRATRTRMIKRGEMPRGGMFYTVGNIIQALVESRKWVNIKL